MMSDGLLHFGLVSGLVALAVGLAMWMLGGRLAKAGYAVVGLLGGGLGAYVISRQLSQESIAMWWVMLGAIAGFGLGWGLHRVWTAIGCGLLLAVLAPALHLAGQGEPLPPILGGDAGVDTPHEVASEPLQEHAPFQDRATRSFETKTQRFQAWWGNLAGGIRFATIVLFGIGASVGLIAGLIYPHPSAVVGSAAAGAGMCLVSLMLLAERYAPSISGWFPQTPHVSLILLGLITAAGVLLQWTIFKPKTDI